MLSPKNPTLSALMTFDEINRLLPAKPNTSHLEMTKVLSLISVDPTQPDKALFGGINVRQCAYCTNRFEINGNNHYCCEECQRAALSLRRRFVRRTYQFKSIGIQFKPYGHGTIYEVILHPDLERSLNPAKLQYSGYGQKLLVDAKFQPYDPAYYFQPHFGDRIAGLIHQALQTAQDVKNGEIPDVSHEDVRMFLAADIWNYIKDRVDDRTGQSINVFTCKSCGAIFPESFHTFRGSEDYCARCTLPF